jgi:hypothetical protein
MLVAALGLGRGLGEPLKVELEQDLSMRAEGVGMALVDALAASVVEALRAIP